MVFVNFTTTRFEEMQKCLKNFAQLYSFGVSMIVSYVGAKGARPSSGQNAGV